MNPLGLKKLTGVPDYYAHPLESGIVMKFHSC